jgi:hypothetical protein
VSYILDGKNHVFKSVNTHVFGFSKEIVKEFDHLKELSNLPKDCLLEIQLVEKVSRKENMFRVLLKNQLDMKIIFNRMFIGEYDSSVMILFENKMKLIRLTVYGLGSIQNSQMVANLEVYCLKKSDERSLYFRVATFNM